MEIMFVEDIKCGVMLMQMSRLDKGVPYIEVYRTKVAEDNQHNWVFFI